MGDACHELAEGGELLAAANGVLEPHDHGRLAQCDDGAGRVVVRVAVPVGGNVPRAVAPGVVRLRTARLLAVPDGFDALCERDPRLGVFDGRRPAAKDVVVLPRAGQVTTGPVESADDAIHRRNEDRQLDGIEGQGPLQALALDEMQQLVAR